MHMKHTFVYTSKHQQKQTSLFYLSILFHKRVHMRSNKLKIAHLQIQYNFIDS